MTGFFEKKLSVRRLNRQLKTIANRISRDDALGKDPAVDDLTALRATVDALIDRLKEERP